MENDFQTFTVEEISLELGDAPFGSNLKNTDYTDDGALVIQGKNIQGRTCDWGDKRHISLEKWKSIPRSHCFIGDLIFPKVGTIGKVGLLSACNGYDEYLLSTNTMRLRVNPKIADQYYVYYYFSWSKTSNLIKALNSKSVQPVFNFSTLKKFKIDIPPLEEQKAIAHILGSLDDKIELNRQMNATLEAMAQALFKSWFVDFDPVLDNALAAGNPIPDELQEKAAAREALGNARKPLPEDIAALFPAAFVWTEEMGWIPEGWEVKSLDELITLIGGGTPKTSVEEYWDGDIPWFSVVDAPNPSDVFVIDTEKHVTQAGIDNSSAKILPTGTTIISARGTVGKCAMVATPMAMNQSCYGIRGKDGISDTYVYYAIYLQVADLQQRSHGSVFSTITRDTFKTIKLPFGSPQITEKLDDVIRPYFDKILSNSLQANTLKQLRDTLLPKLLSGELRIPDAEKLVEEIQP